MALRYLIRIRGDEHVAIVGKNGSGKSHLWRRELMGKYAYHPIILDPKGEVMAPFPILHRYDPRKGAQTIRLPFGAPPDEWDAVIGDIWNKSPRDDDGMFTPRRTVIVDEFSRLIRSPQSPPRNTVGMLKEGRRPGCCMWIVSQRPKRIPTDLLSEAQHFFIFRLTLKDDRKAVIEATDEALESMLTGLGRGEFVYYHDATGRRFRFERRRKISW